MTARWTLLLAVLATPAPLAAQGAWRAGGGVGALLRLEPGADTGVEARLSLARRQTPRVEVRGTLGFLWFPERRNVLRFRGPEGASVTEVRTGEMVGPFLSMAAARVVPAGASELLLEAEIALGLLRERSTFSSTRPDVVRPSELTDWETTPTWALAAILRLPEPGAVGLRPELAARLRTITAAGDGFIPVASLSLGLGAP